MEKQLQKIDAVLYELIQKEIQRQQDTIDLIPSESLVSTALLEALGSPLTNKYSEGEVGKRYYPGNEYCDQIESLAKQRAKQAFGLGDDWEANVQALSGSPANLAVYFGLLQVGETMMGMALSSGGHLTHGHKVNASGKVFKSVQYEVGIDGKIDYEKVAELAREHKPKIIISGYTAYPLKIDFAKFGEIAKEVGAYHLADISHIAGLVSANCHPLPFPFADVVTMTTHKTLNGPRGAVILAKKELMDKINRAIFPGLQGGPHNHQTAAIAFTLGQVKTSAFLQTQKQIILNAKTLADSLIEKGFNLVAGGTENHLLLVDLRSKNISGMEAQNLLEKAGLIANRNTVPGDPSPFNPSGVRMGSPVMTFRGMKEGEAKMIGEWIDRVITQRENPEQIKLEVVDLCSRFKVPYV
ncbi:MAG: serine hydroxymethyltransferase [Candidatus Gribaldobacteria bacterium]|nr:serine hydroxymethyltransferase [Candidatus Gribaldobacteria bacterium]